MNGSMINSTSFGVIIPGRTVLHEWKQIGANRLVMEIRNPVDVSDMMFFLLPGASLPNHSGAAIYFSLDGNDAAWTFLGAITMDKPSTLMRTRWENVNVHFQTVVTLGVALEPLEMIDNLVQDGAVSRTNERMHWALNLGQDLYNYIMSFSTKYSEPSDSYMVEDGNENSNKEMLLLPLDVMDRWMERFKAKYKRNPNFVFGNNDS